MGNILRTTFLVLITLVSSFSEAQVVESIEFSGLKRTKESYLRRTIEIQEGDTLKLNDTIKNVQFLKDLNLFFEVDYKVEEVNTDKYSLTFVIKEANYVYPIIANGGSSERLNFTLGVNDINFLGKGHSLGLIYQYYDRNSFKIFQISLRHKNQKTGHGLVLGKYSTIEPLYFMDQTLDFNYDNYHASGELYWWFNRYLRIKVGGMYLYEIYKSREEDFSFGGMDFGVNQNIGLHKAQARIGLNYNQIHYHLERREGIFNEVETERISTFNIEGSDFFKVSNTTKYFKRIKYRGNISARLKLGLATNNFSPFSPFVIDDFINVRGVGNRVARGTAEGILNLEYAVTLVHHKYFYLQTSVFTDMAVIRPAGEKFINTFSEENTYYYSGLGLKIHSRWLYNAIFRIDYGFNLQNLSQSGLVIGFGHYF